MLAIYLLILVPGINCLVKQWRFDTNWRNADNWQNHQLPCADSLVEFAQDVVVSIYVNGNATWQTLVLPDNAELILDPQWQFNSQRPCDTPRSTFVNWKPRSWFNPLNWESQGSQKNLAVPHSEMIPCLKDVVRFSPEKTVNIDFHNADTVNVGELKFGDRVEDKPKDFITSLGKYQIHNFNPKAEIRGNATDCTDPLGCSCGNHLPHVMQLICSNVGELCKSEWICDNPVRLHGHCCDSCGAVMKLKIDPLRYTSSAMNQLLESLRGSREIFATVSAYVHRIEDSHNIQVSITDGSTNEHSIALAESVHEFLKKDKETSNIYGVLEISFSKSGLAYRSSGSSMDPQKLQAIASNLITLLIFVIIAAIGAALYFLHRRGRLRLSSSREELAVGYSRYGPEEEATVSAQTPVEILVEKPVPSSSPSADPEESEGCVVSSGQQPERVDNEESASTAKEKVKSPGAVWKKFQRAFYNPLFGNPAASSRLSGRWSMSGLLKTSVTQENPIFNISIPNETKPNPDSEVVPEAPEAPEEPEEPEEEEPERINDENYDEIVLANDEPIAGPSHEPAARANPLAENVKRVWAKAAAKLSAAQSDAAADETKEDKQQLTLSEETEE